MAFKWLTQPGENVPPAFMRVGTVGRFQMTLRHGEEFEQFTFDRAALVDHIRKAARYAIRAATMNGTEMDFDPDAMVQNFVIGVLGHFTEDGKPSDSLTRTGGGGDGGEAGTGQPRGAPR